MVRQSEVEEGYDDYGDEEGKDVEEEEKQSQEGQQEKDQSFEYTAPGRPRREAAGRGIDHLEPTIGGKSYDTKTGTQFFQIKGSKGQSWTDDYYKATVDTCFAQIGLKRGSRHTRKGQQCTC